MKRIFAIFCTLSFAAYAQVFTVLPDIPPAVGVPGPRPTQGLIFGVDNAALAAQLAQAPQFRPDAPLETYALAISLPDPMGQLVECLAARSDVMEPALAAQFPLIQTYIIQSADKTASGRIEVAPRGITGMLRTPHGTWMIDRWQAADPVHAAVYWLHDLPGGGDWVCYTTEGVHGFGTPEALDASYAPRAVQTLRTVRLAVACTGEYGLYQSQIQGHSPNTADPLAAIVTMIGRANVVYEADLAVHFNLVANNNLIMFTDPNTDPYPSDCSGAGGADCSGSILTANPAVLSSNIGNANFDIGHCVTRIFGGVANLSSVCTSNKAGGVSGIPRGGDIDPFTALVIIHEMGHQFGANHTFSGTRGRCAGNVNLSTAWEAGSGSSPMAYAGGCPVGDAPPTDNIAQFADPFFHHGSLGEMKTFLASGTASCAVPTVTTNNVPTFVSTTGDSAIPPGTPFTLAAAATDADNEVLTYSWEEFDSGVARPLSGTGSDDNGRGALFRAFPPVLTPQRTFPRMSDVLSGIPTPGERLPTVTGGPVRRFRVVVRDNHAGSGASVTSPTVNLTLPTGTSPFAIVTPSQGTILQGGSTQVMWTVGGTNVAPISCATVTLHLSLDDGATFPQLLGTFPNNGSAMVTLPETSAVARIRMDADGKIFFAVSRQFVIQRPCIADINGDGGVDGPDVGAFFDLWSEGDPRGDINADGGIDGADVQFFFFHWESGC